MPKVDGNLAEGYVIKPIDALYDNENNRVSIKIKNSKHLESAPAVKQPKQPAVKKEVTLSEED